MSILHIAITDTDEDTQRRAANDAAQRLTRAAATIVSNLHQVRVPTPTEVERVQDTAAELMDALAARNELEKADGRA